MILAQGHATIAPSFRAFIVTAIAALCLLGATPSLAIKPPSWSQVVDIAQGIVAPATNVAPAGSDATAPVSDAANTSGTGGDSKTKGICPTAGAEIFDVGIDNFIDGIEFGAGCSCKVECPLPIGGSVKLPTFGVVLKAWQGSQVLEVVRRRGCSPAYPFLSEMLEELGSVGKAARSSGGEGGFYHVHALPNPIQAALATTMETSFCHLPALGDNFPYFSEIDFTWNPANSKGDIASPTSWPDLLALDPIHIAKKVAWGAADKAKAAAILLGESLLCTAECMVLTAGGKPISGVPFSNCSGCNGLVAPYTGQLTGIGGRRGAELLAHRFVNLAMNARGWRGTTGKDSYCNLGNFRLAPNFPKNEFRLQALYPREEERMRKFGAFFIPVVDEAGKQGAFNKQDYVFILWKRRECCATLRYCPPVPS